MLYKIIFGMIFGLTAAFYYLCVVLQCFGVIYFTNREIEFPKALIPYYYFFKGDDKSDKGDCVEENEE